MIPPPPPPPQPSALSTLRGRDRRYLSPRGRGERQGSHSPDQPTSISTEMLGDRAQFGVGIQPNGLVLVAFLVRRDILLGRHRDVTIGIAGLGKAATTLGRSIPPPRQLRPLRFARGLGLAYALIVFVAGQSRGGGAEDEGCAKSDLRLAEHCRISCAVVRLDVSSAE